MKLLNWLRRDRVAELLADNPLEAQRRHALRADAELLVRSYCQPIPCDIEDHYVCAVHRVAGHV